MDDNTLFAHPVPESDEVLDEICDAFATWAEDLVG